MTTVHKLLAAREDLLDIWCHITRDNPYLADSYLDHLEERLNLLVSHPGMGRSHDDLAPGVHAFPVDDYLIFYRPAESGIDVIRVLHGACDIEALFREDRP